MTTIVDKLNQQYAIDNLLTFNEGPGQLIFININTEIATASICLNGGQVLAYKPATQSEDLFFVSQNAYYEEGKSTKGGAPVCWPWFAANTEDESLPFHGFVRDRPWDVKSTQLLENGDILVSLVIKDNEEIRSIWPCSFELTENITIGQSLKIELITTNTSDSEFSLTQAIHSYFSIGDINQISISGLENCEYLDKVDNYAEKTQHGAITVNQEVDRIYQNTTGIITIHDNSVNRSISIENEGSATTVVWNPWIDISRNSNDLCDDDYLKFVCVETANAAQDIITIPPSAEYRISATYQIS